MAHIKDNEYPYSGWKRDFPFVSFPENKMEKSFPSLDIWWVHSTDMPSYDVDMEEVVEGQPELVDGIYQQTWEIREKEDSILHIPEEVEGWQAEVAMRATSSTTEGKSVWDRVQDLIALMPEGIEKITAQTVLKRGKIRRDSAMLAQLSPLVPLNEEEVDDLFRLAYSIEA